MTRNLTINKNKLLIFALIPLILSIGIAPILPFVDIIQEADALKSKGTYTKKYGSNTGICGLQLCSEISESTPVKLSEKAKKGTHTEKTETTSDIKGDQMEDHVNSQDVIMGKPIHTDFPTIETLTVVHANKIDPATYILEYEITAGNKELNVIQVSVHSDIETIQSEIPLLEPNTKGIQYVIINANDPSSITAQIESYN